MHKLSMSKYLIGERFLFDPYNNSLLDQQENDDLVRLGANESRALCLLIEEPGAIIHRNRLHDYVWREQGFEVDDSSLTQAISTLRKALKDSTKSPAFIKTVPKRGYQMIAPVSLYDEPVCCASEESAFAEEEPLYRPQIISSASAPMKMATPAPEVRSKPQMWLSLCAIVFAIVLPCLVLFVLPPKTDTLTPIMNINGLSVVTTKQNPPLGAWKPLITQCINQYLVQHNTQSKPIMIVVSGGQNAQLWINYIHSGLHGGQNLSQKYLTSLKDGAQLCQ